MVFYCFCGSSYVNPTLRLSPAAFVQTDFNVMTLIQSGSRWGGGHGLQKALHAIKFPKFNLSTWLNIIPEMLWWHPQNIQLYFQMTAFYEFKTTSPRRFLNENTHKSLKLQSKQAYRKKGGYRTVYRNIFKQNMASKGKPPQWGQFKLLRTGGEHMIRRYKGICNVLIVYLLLTFNRKEIHFCLLH